MRTLREKIGFPLLALLAALLSACSVTKYVPEGKLLLNKVRISSDNKDINPTGLQSYLRQTPNPKLFDALNFNVALYSLSSPDTALWINRFLRKIGDEPVVYDSTLTEASRNELRKYLANKGFLDAEVETDVTSKKRKAYVHYKLKCNRPYVIRQFDYRVKSPEIRAILMSDTANATIKAGDRFDMERLESERSRIASLLRDRGYFYFDKEYIGFMADTNLNHQADVALTVRPMRRVTGKNMVEILPHERYRIRDIRYRTLNDITDLQDTALLDQARHLTYKGVDVYANRHFVRPRALYNNTHLEEDSVYAQSDVEKTYAKLSALRIFKSQTITFTEAADSARDSTGCKALDCEITLTPAKTQSFSVELEGTNNEGDFGVAGKLSYTHNNIFRGGESFRFNLRGANESLIGTRSIWDVSTEASLHFPTLLFPGLTLAFRHNNPANSQVYLNFSYQIRDEYTRIIAGAGMRYKWFTQSGVNHQIDLVDFSYVYLPYVSDHFREMIDQSLLRYSYEDHLIMHTGYSVGFSNTSLSDNRSGVSVYGALETGGNLLYGACAAAKVQRGENGSYRLGNIPFAQYAKLDADFSYTQRIDDRNSIVYHAGAGIGVPYGNSTILPFEKRYYGGGANHVRGWSARSLGPGAYDAGDKTDYMRQSGDISLCANVEYRTHLVWKLELAAFLDAGNIWTLADEGQEGGQFRGDTFYKQIALGYGIGLRFNFEYFVIRLDWGLKAFDPGQGDGQRWRFTNTWNVLTDTALHFAVGYPF